MRDPRRKYVGPLRFAPTVTTPTSRYTPREAMPELPDVTVYVERILERVKGHALENVRFASPFVLRTVTPSIRDTFGKRVTDVTRLGKRIVLHLEDELVIVIHLMVSGRFRWG